MQVFVPPHNVKDLPVYLPQAAPPSTRSIGGQAASRRMRPPAWAARRKSASQVRRWRSIPPST